MTTPAFVPSILSAAATGAALAAFAAAPAAVSARTVYDAGAALHANVISGSPVGADGATYTDAQGGTWQYLRANDELGTNTAAFGMSVASGTYYQGIGGTESRKGSPFIHVNVSGAATVDGVTGGTPVEADELYIHPGNPSAANANVLVRFIVPEAGWYSAFVTAHDVSKGGTDDKAGAEVRLLANNVLQARGVVTLEDYTGPYGASWLLTHRFDFQMPVRRMAAGETIDFMVCPNGAYENDATGLKAYVTKEDAGAFYDSGLALNENVSASSLNPFGTAALGMWYCCYADTSAPQSQAGAAKSCPADAFAAWAPGQLTKKLTVFDSSATRTAAPLLKGFFMSSRIGSSPYICVNNTSTNDTDVAPGELYSHPHAGNWTQWSALRFRPPRGGLYSASVVVRDVNRDLTNGNDSDGVMAYLLVGEKVVTNAVVSAESFNATAHFTFDARLVTANEPIDVVISPHNGHSSDATAISAIFRREADAYDAGYSMAALDWANATRPAHPFADALGGGAKWDVGTSAAASGTSATTMPYAFLKVNNSIDFFGYGVASDGGLPRVMISTNGVAQLYNSTDKMKFCMSPCELWAHPNNSGNVCPVLSSTVPSDGLYRIRAYARDISNGGNGIRLNVSTEGLVADSQRISLENAAYPYEGKADGDRLWLRAGAALNAVIDPVDNNHNNDGTALSVCYVKEGEATNRVVNVDFCGTDSGSGRFSGHTGRGREGWSDWTNWNALRAGSSGVADCYEADGETRRNVTVTIARDSGEAINMVFGSGASAMLNHYIASTDTSDTYTFRVSKLAKNAPYTLYLYSAKATSTGNATFTVGSETKGVEKTWNFSNGTKVLTRFDATSDANGEITGTFAAADANGGAFNGLTLVGDFPEYKSSGFVLIVF